MQQTSIDEKETVVGEEKINAVVQEKGSDGSPKEELFENDLYVWQLLLLIDKKEDAC
jgi:hypothetical protein